MSVDRNGLVVLSRDECLALLRGSHLGRVAVSIDALPVILPVQYAVLGDDIVFRTGVGTKLDAALRGAVVAFEIDSVDPLYHRGWSVLVTGHSTEVIDPEELVRCELLPLQPWLPGSTDRFVKIEAAVISGRVIDPAQVAVAV
jgi:nitroimidazol reductase NimA-like FMN-containing flavoprotein (pyridoxamine 5'-phosphate oxidase superfamily)